MDVVGGGLQVDEEALRRGALIVEFDWPLCGRFVPLQAIYPDSFPRLRPVVRLRGDSSSFPRRHCSPIDGNLCLLGRESRQWLQKWTLRKLLDSQLESSLTDTGEEDQQGEPAEYWWNHYGRRGSYCLVDSAWRLGDATAGTLELRYRLLRKNNDAPQIQAFVTKIKNAAGDVIEEWSGAVSAELAAGKKITIPWIFINETILPDGRYECIVELMKRFATVPRFEDVGDSLTARWFAVLYKMETGFQTEGTGWLFPFIYGTRKAFQPVRVGKPRVDQKVVILSTYRAGAVDLGVRAPATGVLRDKKVAVLGLGAVGAPLAIELARNGCRKLHLLDHDVVEPGNSIRWPLGASAWARGKCESLSTFIRQEYPWVEVIEHSHAIGTFTGDQPENGDHHVLESILSDVDMVVDGTASYGVSTILSDLCRAQGIPLICLYASPPVEGGIVARFTPASGCPTCLEFAHAAGTIVQPPGFGDDERGLYQPPGCAERTFTGASYDLQELSMQAVRLAVETLGRSDQLHESVVQSLSFVANGNRTPPTWRVDPLPRAEGCSCSTTR